MTALTRYGRPHPQIADHRDDDADSCDATTHGDSSALRTWWCTRAKGHKGDHQAGGPGGVMYASWPAEEVAE